MERNNVEVEFKVEMDGKSICRCCFSTEKRMSRIDVYRQLFIELADIFISDSDGLPQSICYECSTLLAKCVKFKRKVLRVDRLLFEYHNRCALFPADGKDPELTKYSRPLLSRSNVLVFDTTVTENGFHQVLQHEKPLVFSNPNETNINIEVSVKIEMSDDDLSIQDVRKNKLNEEVADIQKDEKEKKRIVNRKINNKRKIIDEQTDLESTLGIKPKKIPRKPIVIDENKIRIITLDPMEQLKQREKESKEIRKFPFPCHLCYRGFNFEVKLKNHMFTHNPERGSYKCELCSMYFSTTQHATQHSLTHTRRYECRECGKRNVDKKTAVNHYRSQHDGVLSVFTCHICGKVFNNYTTHRGHLRNHHSGSSVKCDECGKSFMNTSSLINHKTIHQGIKNYTCEKCGKKFRTWHCVKTHMIKHDDSRDYYCVECDMRFKTAINLKQHLTRSSKHIDKEVLKFECATCCKRFETSALLETHIRVQHEGVREYRCNLCDAALASQVTLKKHMRYKHEGVRLPFSFTCDTCGRKFRAKSTLVTHVRTHTGEKPFECPTCGRRFSQSTAMKTHIKLVHMKIHTSAKSDGECPKLLPKMLPVTSKAAKPAEAKRAKLNKPLPGVKRRSARRPRSRKP